MDIATVSVIVSGVVGVSGAVVTPVALDALSAKRREDEARDARIDELRGVIDDAAVAAVKVIDLMPKLEEAKKGNEALEAAVPRLFSALLVVWQQEARLKARLGWQDDVARRYRDLHEALGRVHTYWSTLLEGESPPEDFTVANDGIVPALNAFYDATSARIGPERLR